MLLKKRTVYPVKKEFSPFDRFTPPLSVPILRLSQFLLRAPLFLWTDPSLKVEVKKIPSYNDGTIKLYTITPSAAKGKLPCLIFYHGGGFVYEGFDNHFRIAMMYAKYGKCKVIYVKYRLAPKYPFPVPQEDAYAAYEWICANADSLGIIKDKIAVTGDSAGGTLAAVTSVLAVKRNSAVRPCFQLLVYPWLDGRNVSDSFKRFTDTPMWNSKCSERITPLTDPHPESIPLYMRSPVETDSFEGMPPAYLETAEFDCLHDDAILYAKRLKGAGIDVRLYQTMGTMHGFDTKVSAPTSLKMIKNRIRYIREMFS